MSQVTTAGRLLGELNQESTVLRDLVATEAGILVERVEATMTGELRLSLSEQLRLSEATIVLAPQFTRQALWLRGQVLSARSVESREAYFHSDALADRWEHSSQVGQ